MLYEDPFTIDIVGKAHFNPICDPNLFRLSFQYQMQLVSFRKAEWILSDERHRVVCGQRLGQVMMLSSLFPFFFPCCFGDQWICVCLVEH